MVSVIVVMRLFCAGIVAAQKPDPAILHGTTAKPPESVPLPAREQQGRHNQHRDTGQSYPDGIHDLRQNPPISKPSRELFVFSWDYVVEIQSGKTGRAGSPLPAERVDWQLAARTE